MSKQHNRHKAKEKQASELVLANKALTLQNKEKDKRAKELILVNEELDFLRELFK